MFEATTFLELALEGRVMSDEVDDFVEEWHSSAASSELHEFLGMTWEEYSLWSADPDYIDIIIAARRSNRVLREAVNDNLRSGERLAARSDDTGKISALRRWIAAQPDR